MRPLIQLSVVLTCASVACARFDPDDTIQLVPATDWSVAEVETLRQAAACWNLRFGTRFEVVRELTSEQTVDVAYNPFTCWASEGRFSFGRQAQIDVCPVEYSYWPTAYLPDVRLFTILVHELGHAAGIRRHSTEWSAIMMGGGMVSSLRSELFHDDDARLLRDATDFVGTPGCDGKTLFVSDAQTGGACGCEFDGVAQVDGGVAAYDAERGQTLVFDIDGQTSTWDGVRWTHHTPGVAPPSRGTSAMAYDSARKRTVLFGGVIWEGHLADTWEWDGAGWVETSPAISPPAREGHVMAYDQERQRVVMFGGVGANQQTFDDTWEYDGTTWTLRAAVTSPPGRVNAAFQFDAVRRTLMLLSGFDIPDDVYLSDQWEWDGTNWSAIASITPPPRVYGRLVSDGTGLLLIGGYTFTQGSVVDHDELWRWDGMAWTETALGFSPRAQHDTAVVFDSARDRVVMIGAGPLFLDNELWEWDGSSWFRVGYRQCGNGTIESIETCDDGNLAQGDGCSDTCQLE